MKKYSKLIAALIGTGVAVLVTKGFIPAQYSGDLVDGILSIVIPSVAVYAAPKNEPNS